MKYLYLILTIALLSACKAGSGEGVTVDTETPTNGDSGESGIQPTLASLQENVLTPICAQCHFGTNAPVGLRMDSLEASTANLINIDASNPQFKRVTPGDAENSYLYLKLIGDPVAGNRMPLGQAPLDDATITVFKQWIDQGAQINAAAVATVSSTRLSTNETAIAITFSQQMNTTTLSGDTILLSQADGALLTEQIGAYWSDSQHFHIVLRANSSVDNIIINDPSLNSVMSDNGLLFDGDRDGISGGILNYAMPDS